MSHGEEQSGSSEERIAEILKRVGARPKPSEEIADEIKSSVRAVWLEEVQRNKQRVRRNRWFAMAASVVAIAGAALFYQPNSEEGSESVLAQTNGLVEYRESAADHWQEVAIDQRLSADIEIRSGKNSFASLMLANGMNVRIDQNTHLKVTAADDIYLLQGGVYAESFAAGQSLLIETSIGQVRDIGTEFEVRATPDEMRVQVRQGLVLIENDAVKESLSEGERLVVSDVSATTKQKVASSDASWNWTHKIPEPFELEGARLSAFLDWWSNETGKTVSFRLVEEESVAQNTILHGSLDRLEVNESLPTILGSTRFKIVDSTADQVILAQ